MLASGEGQGPREDEEKALSHGDGFAGHDQRPLVGAEPKRDQGGQREFVRAGDGVRDADRLGSPRTWTERESDGARHDHSATTATLPIAPSHSQREWGDLYKATPRPICPAARSQKKALWSA
jgi:hypothetical protein